jgi:DNA-binding XRE family transcriptional regulator
LQVFHKPGFPFRASLSESGGASQSKHKKYTCISRFYHKYFCSILQTKKEAFDFAGGESLPMKAKKSPKRLAEKLKDIRYALHLSQVELIKRLGAEDELIQAHISAFERKRNNRVPSLEILLKYARAVGISTDILIDDELDLPDKLPVKN